MSARFGRRTAVTAVAVLLAVAALTGCGRAERDSDQVLRALVRTQNSARRFSYTDTTGAGTVGVDGAVEDAFRYKARLTRDGNPVWDEVVSDDVLVDRFASDDAIASFSRTRATPGTSGLATNAPIDPTVLAALRAHRWVRDDSGAPSLISRPNERHIVGTDPMYDAVTMLRYCELLSSSLFVERFSRENLDYRESEDPFPKPAANSSILRYDFKPPPLPHPNQGDTAPPSLANFRKLSVYVEHGLVVEIREKIDVAQRLPDLERLYHVRFQAGTSPAERVDIAVSALNELNHSAGADPVVVRSRVLRFDTGGDTLVELPADTTPGSLAFLVDRGRSSGSKTPSTVVAGAPPA